LSWYSIAYRTLGDIDMYNDWAGTEITKGRLNAEMMLVCIEVKEDGFAVRRTAENDKAGWKTREYPEMVLPFGFAENLRGKSPAAFIDLVQEEMDRTETIQDTLTNSMAVMAFLCGGTELPSFALQAEDSETFRNLILNLKAGQYLLELTWAE